MDFFLLLKSSDVALSVILLFVLSLLFKLLIQIRTLKCPLSLILVYVRLVTEEASDRQSFTRQRDVIELCILCPMLSR